MCDCEPVDFQSNTRPKARREYRCAECRCTIKAGERYNCFSWVHEGRWWTERLCLRCEEAHQDVMHASGDYCWCVGSLYDEFHEWPEAELTPALRAFGERAGLLAAEAA